MLINAFGYFTLEFDTLSAFDILPKITRTNEAFSFIIAVSITVISHGG